MKRLKELLMLFPVILSLVFLAKPAAAGNDWLQFNDRLQAGPWLSRSGIQIAPLYVTPADLRANYLSLDEATRQGQIEVSETGSVNELEVTNHSKMRVLLLAGEVVKGGKQDRMVGRDMILAPGKTRTIDVFCVEHGRWSPSAAGLEFKGSSLMADKELRQKAQAGGGVAANQSRVWEEVAKSIDKFEVAAPTQNYHEILKSDKFKDAEGIIDFFARSLGKDSRVAGLALAYDGEVQSIEYFAGPALFAKYRDKLVRAYVTSALKHKTGSAQAGPAELKIFVNAILSEETHQYKTEDEIVVESRSDRLESYELLTPRLKSIHYVRYAGAEKTETPTGPDMDRDFQE